MPEMSSTKCTTKPSEKQYVGTSKKDYVKTDKKTYVKTPSPRTTNK
jgi:hypothetical protein